MRKPFSSARAAVMMALLVLASLAFPACSEASVKEAAGNVVVGSASIGAVLRAELKPDDSRLVKVDAFTRAAEEFESQLSSDDPNKQVELLPLLTNLIGSFQSNILPLVATNKQAGLAMVGVDMGLRILARRFKSAAAKVEASPQLAEAAEATMQSRGVNARTAVSVLQEYLKSPRIVASQ